MRVLFSFVGGSGHLDPLVPIARAVRSAGHTVAFAGGRSMVATVEALGFDTNVTGSGPPMLTSPTPLVEPDAGREDRVLRDVFAGTIARERAGAIIALGRDWAPDLVVCDEADFGAMIAAEFLGLPHAVVVVSPAGSFIRPEIVAGRLDELRAELDLPPDPDLAAHGRHLVIAPMPPSFRDPSFPLPPTAHHIRPAGLGPHHRAAVADRVADVIGGGPIVYVTLGTVFNVESGDLLSRLLAGVGDLPVTVVATVGRQLDPRDVGPQPRNVHLERYIPQASLLPHCHAVVCHGGSGTVIGALAHGLPLVVLPIGADQPHNARRCVELGVGGVLDPVRATPVTIRDAVGAVLTEPTWRRAASAMEREVLALPTADHARELLERIVQPAPS